MSEPLRARVPADPAGASAPNRPESRESERIGQRDIALHAREQAEAEAAVAAVMRREEAKAAGVAAKANFRGAGPPLKLLLVGALVVLNAYMWFGNPQWLRVSEPKLPEIDYYANSWKIAVYLQHQRIEEFRAAKGHLPATVEQAGPAVHGVQYRPIAQRTYQLSAGEGPQKIVYFSTDSISVLVGRTLLNMGLTVGGVR